MAELEHNMQNNQKESDTKQRSRRQRIQRLKRLLVILAVLLIVLSVGLNIYLLIRVIHISNLVQTLYDSGYGLIR